MSVGSAVKDQRKQPSKHLQVSGDCIGFCWMFWN